MMGCVVFWVPMLDVLTKVAPCAVLIPLHPIQTPTPRWGSSHSNAQLVAFAYFVNAISVVTCWCGCWRWSHVGHRTGGLLNGGGEFVCGPSTMAAWSATYTSLVGATLAAVSRRQLSWCRGGMFVCTIVSQSMNDVSGCICDGVVSRLRLLCDACCFEMALVSQRRLLHNGAGFATAFVLGWHSLRDGVHLAVAFVSLRRSYCGCTAAHSWISRTPGVHKYEVADSLHEQEVVGMWSRALRL